MSTSRLVTVTCLLALNACSNGTNPVDAGPEGGIDAASDVGVEDVITMFDAGYDGPVVDPECAFAADAAAPSGSCVTLDVDAGIECNPVTNVPCNVDAGEACDFQGVSGFHCYPPPNTVATCGACDDTATFCLPTNTCVPIDGGAQECARFCCVDGDCAGGHCDMTTLMSAPVGVCVK